jgi:2-hydroxychromene-2-carboxylate isomerase
MTRIEIEGFFDCSCVWAYLGFAHLARFAATAPVAIRWRPVLGQELFDIVNPAARWPLSPVKQAYYQRDLAQWAAYLECPLAADAGAPADATDCMLACVAAGRWDRLDSFARAALDAAWADGRDIADRAVLKQLWESAGLPPAAFEPGLGWPGVAAELAANTRELMARGGFGTPTFFVGDDMFFGNDAIPLLERAADVRLRQAGVQR